MSERARAPARSSPEETSVRLDTRRTTSYSSWAGCDTVSSDSSTVSAPTDTALTAARPLSAPAIAPGSSTRRACPWWRLPEASRNRTSALSTASGGDRTTQRSSR